jgi:hypothetical protein
VAGPELKTPRCIFKGHNFTSDPPPETRYDFAAVPQCETDLGGSVLLRPTSRRQWFACIQELESLAQESLDRRAQRLMMNTPSGLPLVYIADRMDIDDPLWGYQIRGAGTGWLQGFITCTVFTTWTHFFEWNSHHIASGMAAARVANSMVGKDDPALYSSEGGETVHQVAARVGVRSADLVKWNLSRFPNISVNSRVQAGTVFFVADPAGIDVVTVEKKGETPKKLANRLGVPCDDLIELNATRHPQLHATYKLESGTELVFRDRAAEPDVFLPTRKHERALDVDGRIANELQAQTRFGDPTTTGVVWPKVAEVGLVAGLGAGKLLVRLALEELRASGEFDFAVLQATMASVSFYEELGFVRVGAVAKYHPEGTNMDSNPVLGYRHWACADESQVEQFGDTSYMMAVKLKSLSADKPMCKMLSHRLVSDWPTVQQGVAAKTPYSGKKKVNGVKSSHNHAGILQPKGSELQVGDMSLNVEEGDDARLQLRYEVEKIVDSRHGQYLVKWKHLPLEEATWERTSSELLTSQAAKLAIGRFKKHPPSHHKSDAGSSSHHGKKSDHGPRWSHKVVRPIPGMEVVEDSMWMLPPPTFFGGLGEPPRPRTVDEGVGPTGLDREHRYWLVVRYASISNKCTLVPLLAAGRFGGCGRRAGRIRWRPAPLKQGYERDAQASQLELVPAESVTGAREAEGEAWCVDDLDVEQAAREQAAAARNKRRAMQDDGEFIDPAFPTPYGASPLGEPLGGTRSGSISRGGLNAVHLLPPGMGRASRPFGGAPAGPSVSHKRKSPGGGTSHKAGAAPARKRKRLAPASNSCLACTKGKHCAHTCGVRGKAAEAAAAAAKAEAEAAAAGTA